MGRLLVAGNWSWGRLDNNLLCVNPLCQFDGTGLQNGNRTGRRSPGHSPPKDATSRKCHARRHGIARE